MPSEILGFSLGFTFYLLIGLIILSTTIPLQKFYVVCEVIEAKKVLEAFINIGQFLEENMSVKLSLEDSSFNGNVIFYSDGKNISIIFENKIFYSIYCDDVEFYVQKVKLYGTVLVSKVNGKIMVKSFE
ncbi:MAG: hypothetical protein N3F64_02370 [Nitrososphaeria archaeon]|nr:hypothetical protein [Nitrososphaeria archaeon]